ncbi:phospho-N-acetylmuramoyl-pentapeptide-transferase [Kibdelosporangium phytohabitans]|nr:phospho-N-acetylmuramoyl-pentapeptide-transferase [Kibdelosporangium phytohabitans]
MISILVAASTALLVSILLTPYLVKVFSRQGFGQEIREEGPQGHKSKRGTPRPWAARRSWRPPGWAI